MENGFSILMFIFSGAILFYALLLALTKDINLIFRNYSAKIKDKKKYAAQFAKLMAVVAIAPALAGLAGLFTENFIFIMIVFVVALIGSIKAGLPLMKDVTDY